MESIFLANPNVNTFYVFEDGNVFLTKNMAEGHRNITKQDFKIVNKDEQTEEKPNKKTK